MSASPEVKLPKSLDELYALSAELVRKFYQVLEDHPVHAGVVLHALMAMHRMTVQTLPQEEQRLIALSLGVYASLLPIEPRGVEPAETSVSVPNLSTTMH